MSRVPYFFLQYIIYRYDLAHNVSLYEKIHILISKLLLRPILFKKFHFFSENPIKLKKIFSHVFHLQSQIIWTCITGLYSKYRLNFWYINTLYKQTYMLQIHYTNIDKMCERYLLNFSFINLRRYCIKFNLHLDSWLVWNSFYDQPYNSTRSCLSRH